MGRVNSACWSAYLSRPRKRYCLSHLVNFETNEVLIELNISNVHTFSLGSDYQIVHRNGSGQRLMPITT